MILLGSIFERSLHHWKEIPVGLLREKEVGSMLVQQKSENNLSVYEGKFPRGWWALSPIL